LALRSNKRVVLDRCNHDSFQGWSHVDYKKLEKDFDQLGDLADSTLNNTYAGLKHAEDYWSKEALIALNFYPYQNCKVFACKSCKSLFLYYTDESGHGPSPRLRLVNSELIRDELACLEFDSKYFAIGEVLETLGVDIVNFNRIVDQYGDSMMVPPDLKASEVFISARKYFSSSGNGTIYLISSGKRVIREITAKFNKARNRM